MNLLMAPEARRERETSAPCPRETALSMGALGNQHARERDCRRQERPRAADQRGPGTAAGEDSCRGTSGFSRGVNFLIRGKDSQPRRPAHSVPEAGAGNQVDRGGPIWLRPPRSNRHRPIQRLGKERHTTPAEAARTSEGWLGALYSQGGSPDRPSGEDRGQRVPERHRHARGGHATFR